MPNCTNCSAPLRPNTACCDYCGSRNDIDLREVHFNTTSAPEADRRCPHCDISLKTIDLKISGTFLIERCNTCLGLFFDPGELEAVLDATVTNVFAINRERIDVLSDENHPGHHIPVKYIKCPVCSNIMNRTNFGARSGVVVDRCKDHGVWLDAGELRKLAEWTKAGGALLEKEREAERRKEQLRRERPKTPSASLEGPASGNGDVDPFDLKNSTEQNLCDMLVRAVRFFGRI